MDNRFVGDVDVFYQGYQMYKLLYELLRFYLQKNALTFRSLPGEVFDWNQCVAYSVESSVKNPTNILLYIACRSHLYYLCSPILSMDEFHADQTIVAQQLCLAAPNPFEPPFGPPSRTTTPSAVNMWQTPRPKVSNMAASAQLTASDAQIAIASVGPMISLMLPLPDSEMS